MASDIALDEINRTLERIEKDLSYLEGIREELARINRFKRMELEKEFGAEAVTSAFLGPNSSVYKTSELKRNPNLW